jgi:glycosyltransferase involved in cell wall biosynthesis
MNSNRTPVVIAGMNCLSGVTSWADRLRAALAGHARFDVRHLCIGPEQCEEYDICVPDVDAARAVVCSLAPVIVVPNYMWELFLTGFEPGVFCVGMCHADCDEQYYSPLTWYEPYISKFIAVSQECTERLAQRIPCRVPDIATLPYGIHVPRSLTRDYHADPLRLVYAGRVTQHQKRVLDFIPLVQQLLKEGVSFVFDIIGEGDHFSFLKDRMQDLFPAGLVRCHPRMSHREMPAVWSSHDIFLQVSDFEGTSVSMLEALAHGVVPVVTAASSGIEGVIQHGKNGFVVAVGDMTAMAQEVKRLAVDRSLLASASRASHETSQAYSMERHSEQFVQILDQILEKGNEIDLQRRYGMFGTTHPVFKQRQLIVHQQTQITMLQRSAMRRFLDKGYRRLTTSKVLRRRVA